MVDEIKATRGRTGEDSKEVYREGNKEAAISLGTSKKVHCNYYNIIYIPFIQFLISMIIWRQLAK